MHRHRRAGRLHEEVDGLAAVLDHGLRRVVEERLGAGVHGVPVLVEDRLAAVVLLDVAALVDDRVAGDVEHQVAGRMGELRDAVRREQREPGEQVEHRLAAGVRELLAGERIEHGLAAEVHGRVRVLVVERQAGAVQDGQACERTSVGTW